MTCQWVFVGDQPRFKALVTIWEFEMDNFIPDHATPCKFFYIINLGLYHIIHRVIIEACNKIDPLLCTLIKNRKVNIAFVKDVNRARGGGELSEEILIVATPFRYGD